MEYLIKAYLFRDDNSLDCRMEITCKNFQDVIQFLTHLPVIDYYDRITILPMDFIVKKGD